jgi:hypothetical protein
LSLKHQCLGNPIPRFAFGCLGLNFVSGFAQGDAFQGSLTRLAVRFNVRGSS